MTTLKRPLRFGPGRAVINEKVLNMTRQAEKVGAGSTLQDKHSLPIVVKRLFTDVNGTIVAKNDPGLVAAGMAVNYPVFLLGEFDRNGANAIGLKLMPVVGTPVHYQNFVNGVTGTSNNIVTPFSPFNTIQSQLNKGDLVSVYADSITAPNYFAWIIQTNPYAPLSAILSNLKSSQEDRRLGPLFCYEVNWYASESQWDQFLSFIQCDNLGTFLNDQVQPYIFKMPYSVQDGFICIATSFVVNQYMGISVFMELASDQMSFNFNIQKIN